MKKLIILFLFAFLFTVNISFAIPNPAATYCKELGYTYKIVKTSIGEHGVCVLPDKSECDEWNFFSGKCGKKYSYCVKNGYDVRTKNDGKNPYSKEYAVCFYKQKEIDSATDLMNLNTILKETLSITNETESTESEAKSLAEIGVTGTPPSYFDWRNVNGSNWMTPVKNQGSCGSCWDFAAVGTVEAKFNIAFNNTTLDEDLSEQDVLSCSYGGSCDGGWSNYALNFIRYTGVVDEPCFPYTATDQPCSNKCTDWQSRVRKICNYWTFPNDANSIKNYLTSYGPVVTYMWYDSSGYWDGNRVFRCNGNWIPNHAVVLVGYNDTGNYWILKNSWGSTWNGDGYFKVGYGTCTIDHTSSSKFYVVIDKTPPSKVTDLTFVNSTGTTATVRWTASSGDAYEYSIAYSTEPITESNYNSARKALFFNFEPPGTDLNTTVEGLIPETNYYFAMKAYDECENPSNISNLVSGTTKAPKVVLFRNNVEDGGVGWNRSYLVGMEETYHENDPVLWHITEHRSTSPTHSWYYGIEGQWNYDTDSTNNGSLISPVFDISNYSKLYLILNYSADLEPQGRGTDWFNGNVFIDGTVWGGNKFFFNNLSTGGSFISEMFSIQTFGMMGGEGRTLKITFDFDTVDNLYNNYEGIYLDDIQIIADDHRPVANAGGPYLNESGSIITFDGSGSYDLDGEPLTYFWDFGDNTSSYEEIVTHYYIKSGVYNVSLIVNDGDSQSYNSYTTATVHADSDNDGLFDENDNCPYYYNPDQNDSDGIPVKDFISYWKFDESEGTVSKDFMNKNNCTIHGAAWTTNCISGSCLRFNNDSNYVDCGNDSSLNIGTGDFSVSVWVNAKGANWNEIISKPQGTVTSYVKGYKMVAGKFYEEIEQNPWEPPMRIQKEGALVTVGTGGEWYINYQSAQMPLNEWHHVVWVLKRDVGSLIYVDGTLNSSKLRTNYQDISNNGNFVIGGPGYRIAGLVYPFNGTIDELAIYNRILTSEEIQLQYQNSLNHLSYKSDGVGDACDNCWYVPNSYQNDTDRNCPLPPYTNDPQCGDACTSPPGSTESPIPQFTLPYMLGVTISFISFLVIAAAEVLLVAVIKKKLNKKTSRKR